MVYVFLSLFVLPEQIVKLGTLIIAMVYRSSIISVTLIIGTFNYLNVLTGIQDKYNTGQII